MTHQFATLYYSRLGELRPRVEAACVARWGEDVLKSRVKTLDAEVDVPVLIIGTLYKEMKAKPNIMDEVTKDVLVQLQERGGEAVEAGKYCGEGDSLVIEDEAGRVALQLAAALADDVLVTGAVVAVRGTLDDQGVLQVESVCCPGLPRQTPLAREPDAPAERYIALVSGLRVGQADEDMLPLQLLSEHLTGHLGCDDDHRLQANIVRVVVAGNATAKSEGANADASNNEFHAVKTVSALDQKTLSQRVRTLDQFLTAISAAIPVDLMPGAEDPTTTLLPQQPFHTCMLPHSSQLATLNLTTNPYCCDVDGVRVLGTSGQPLDDMQRYLPGDDRMSTLARTLDFQHMAPTAPDTLGCYPFAATADDPFIIRQCPHIYFAANQPRFESKMVDGPGGQQVRVIMVPDFHLEHTCVLVNLDTLDCRPLKFAGLAAAAADDNMEMEP